MCMHIGGDIGAGVSNTDTRLTHTHTHTCRPVDGTSMNEECEAVDAVQPQVDHHVCAVRFLT